MSVPIKFSEQLIRQTLQTKGAWIHQQRERIRSRAVIESAELETGATVVFKGNTIYLLLKSITVLSKSK